MNLSKVGELHYKEPPQWLGMFIISFALFIAFEYACEQPSKPFENVSQGREGQTQD